jgi:hypothetical protein
VDLEEDESLVESMLAAVQYELNQVKEAVACTT